ncbi:hypothetical protein [Kribbella sp. NPDC004875]|uniref:hypothetical protein n=1 Tax=Kribbella sp. NPDC004875 TaxID=3364107 RepID=UPI0036C2B536
MVRLLALVAVLTLTACTTQPDTPAPVPTLTPTVVPLRVNEAMKAALVVSDLPKGWDGGVAVDPTPTPGVRAQYDPPECLTFRHPTDILGKPATAVRGQYFTREQLQWVTESVWSWPTQLDKFISDLTSQFTKCSKYTMVPPGQETYYWVAKQLPVQGLTNAFAVRYDTSISEDGIDAISDYVAFVVRGGTVVELDAEGDEITDTVFIQLVRKAAARLDAAAG